MSISIVCFCNAVRPPDSLEVLGLFREPLLLVGVLSPLPRVSATEKSRSFRFDPEAGCEEARVGVCASDCCADDGIGPTERRGDDPRLVLLGVVACGSGNLILLVLVLRTSVGSGIVPEI